MQGNQSNGKSLVFNERIVLSEFTIKINRDRVFQLIDCHPDSSIYKEIEEEFTDLEGKVLSCIKPGAVIQFGKLHSSIETKKWKACTPVCYVLMTIGDSITRLGQQYFSQGDYLAGMLVDAMADDYLFQMDDRIQVVISEKCRLWHIGVLRRLEAPLDISVYAQRVILDETGADHGLGLGLTEGYMFTPIKSIGYIVVLTEDETIFRLKHDCRACGALNCKLRKDYCVNIDVIRGNSIYSLKCREKESLMEAMIRQGCYINADCGGRGTCGKCKVQVMRGRLKTTIQDQKILSKKALAEGFRLACRAYPREDCIIRLPVDEKGVFAIVTENAMNTAIVNETEENAYAIAVDIGTTTIAAVLTGLTSGRIVKTYSAVNKQRAFGTDVVSRIQASNNGKKRLLQKSIQEDLLEGFAALIRDAHIDKKMVQKIAIAANTVMGHLLMGYSCDKLGVYPFTPVTVNTIKKNFKEIFFSNYLAAPVILLPGISAYVGADIMAGLVLCNFDKIERPCMLIDLGTNGEIVIGMKDRVLAASTAAGPAFEGGNISSGVGSIAGAVCSAVIKDGVLKIQTIDDKSPIGICGTGVVEIVAELLRAEFIDDTGLLKEEYFKDGYLIAFDPYNNPIVFTQKDIRKIQLAKAAICAGVETLMMKYGITYEEVDTVYLAGGFGYSISIDKALAIGLLPKGLSDKIKTIGNSSLAGAVKYLTCQGVMKSMKRIAAVSEEISLGSDILFYDLYVENINFSKVL
jgi:uncharacterized 2Fe-2S/4Fe-4S cluster protein (DUF4445 family)